MIYLDHNATTPVADEVLEAMLPWFQRDFGNPSSIHAAGRGAAEGVEAARARAAALLNGSPRGVVFTSGATEANNLALKGAWVTRSPGRSRVLVTAAEHKSVLEVARALPAPATVDIIPVDSTGMIDVAALEEILDENVAVVSVIAANNEVGTLNPIERVAELAHGVGAVVHTDATQWAGKAPIDLQAWRADLVSISAHKFYGPKGVGALFIQPGVRLGPVQDGGGQERGLRGGTLNVPGIVGLGAAASLASARLEEDAEITRRLRDRMFDGLSAAITRTSLNGHPRDRLPNTLNVRFVGADAEAVLASAPGVAASTGSACTSAVPTPSHVLTAMGLATLAADECVRFSLGRSTTHEEIDRAIELIADAVARVRALSSGSDAIEGYSR